MQGLPALYIVSANDDLKAIDFREDGVGEFLTSERVWSSEEGDNPRVSLEDRTNIAKVAVLAYFLSFSRVDQALGKPCLCVETFNKYWIVRRLETFDKISRISEYARRVPLDRYRSLDNEFADEIARKLIGW